MSNFEDFIGELKEDNLIEMSVLEPPVAVAVSSSDVDDHLIDLGDEDRVEVSGPENGENGTNVELQPEAVENFYEKWALNEVGSLQLVEHLFAAIEREQLKKAPEQFDDLPVKKALSRFLQFVDDETSENFVGAERELLIETEAWNTTLLERDKDIDIASLRRYVENCKPVLSSKALISIARFYRNASFNEETRNKFEFVITRLFARERGDETRCLLFIRKTASEHLKNLYAEWSSVSIYAEDGAADEVDNVTNELFKFIAEAEEATSFDDLIGNGFFDRFRNYKSDIGGAFYNPDIVAVVIEANVRTGNQFVLLVDAARQQQSKDEITERYGYSLDDLLTSATSKTINLARILETEYITEEEPEKEAFILRLDNPYKEGEENEVFNSYSKATGGWLAAQRVNKFLVAVTFAVVIACTGLYFWADNSAASATIAEQAKAIDLKNSPLKDHIKEAVSSDQAMYGITSRTWEVSTEEEKQKILSQSMELAKTNGLNSVKLIDDKGHAVAYASPDRSEIIKR